MQVLTVVVEVEVQTLDFFWPVAGETMGSQKVWDLLVRESKDDLESQRGAFAADDLEAEVADLIPAGVVFFGFFVKEIFLQVAAYGEFIKGGELSFDEKEGIKGIFQQKMGHAVFG